MMIMMMVKMEGNDGEDEMKRMVTTMKWRWKERKGG